MRNQELILYRNFEDGELLKNMIHVIENFLKEDISRTDLRSLFFDCFHGLLELAGKAGAIVRIDATVLIDRELFDEYLEQFREESTLKSGKRYAR